MTKGESNIQSLFCSNRCRVRGLWTGKCYCQAPVPQTALHRLYVDSAYFWFLLYISAIFKFDMWFGSLSIWVWKCSEKLHYIIPAYEPLHINTQCSQIVMKLLFMKHRIFILFVKGEFNTFFYVFSLYFDLFLRKCVVLHDMSRVACIHVGYGWKWLLLTSHKWVSTVCATRWVIINRKLSFYKALFIELLWKGTICQLNRTFSFVKLLWNLE